jgi:hypothetical protein
MLPRKHSIQSQRRGHNLPIALTKIIPPLKTSGARSTWMHLTEAQTVNNPSGWLPILVLPLTAVACRDLLPPWVFMWILSFSIYISLKAHMVEIAITNPSSCVALGSVSSGLARHGCGCFPGCEATRNIASAYCLAMGNVRNNCRCNSALGSGAIRSAGTTPATRVDRYVGLILILHFGTFQLVALV